MTALLSSSAFWALVLQSVTSLLLSAIGVYLASLAGIMLLGVAGAMSLSALAALIAAEAAGDVWVGVAAGAVTGGVVGAAFAFAVVRMRANSLIVGLALNFLATGLTGIIVQRSYGSSAVVTPAALSSIPAFKLPFLAGIPVLGPALAEQNLLFYLALLSSAVIGWWASSTRSGLTVRFVGTAPDIVRGAGRSVDAAQWGVLVIGGAFIGLAATQVSLAFLPQFQEGMTAQQGLVSLLLVLVAASRMWLLGLLVLGYAVLNGIASELAVFGMPVQLAPVVPYVGVLVAVAVPQLRRRLAGKHSDVMEPSHAHG